MNTFNWETIRAGAIKFGDNISYYCTQVKFVLELSHASCYALKSIKSDFQIRMLSFSMHNNSYQTNDILIFSYDRLMNIEET